ncbi:MAG: rhomboid family intramembrane serine protease [Lachnospiraceae bacterium]|nr:rhomboid family intramembrane serine protease [Lachnospiraceae bacterium]
MTEESKTEKSLGRFLEQNRYRLLGYNADSSIFWYIREYGATAYVVTIADMQKKTMDPGVLMRSNDEIVKRIEPVLKKKMEILTLVLASHSEEALKMCREKTNYWYLDLQEQKMYLYEHQQIDFDNLAEKLDAWIVENGIVKSVSPGMAPVSWKAMLPFHILAVLYILCYVFFNVLGQGNPSDWVLSSAGVFGEGHWYQILSYTFIHGSFSHLLMNVFTLYVVAMFAAGMFKPWQTFFGYLWSGAVAGAFSLAQMYYKRLTYYTLGASGAVYGLMGMVLFYIMSHREKFKKIGTWQILLFMGLIIAETSLFASYTDGTNHLAHVAGFLGGYVFAFVLEVIHRSKLRLAKNRKDKEANED